MYALCAANAAYLAGLVAGEGDDACIVAGTGAPLARMLRRGGAVATTLDEHEDMLRANVGSPLSAGIVIGAAPVVQLLEDLGVRAVLPFKSGPRLWKMAEWQGLRVLATADKLTRQLENKLALTEIAGAAEARIPDTVTVRLDEGLAAAANEIALPRVFQPAVGFAGAGTVLLRAPRDIVNLVEHAPGGVTIGKLVEYVDGEPVTINGVVIPPGVHGADETDGEVLVGMVARQLTGIPGLTPTDFGSCGNDWALPPQRAQVIAARSLAGRIGEVLAARGFAGAFGIDAVIPTGGGVPVLIEINPRWTASLALQVELQELQGLPTLLDAHLAAFGWEPDQRASLEELRAAYGHDEDAGCTRGVEPVSTVIAYNSSGRDAFIDPAFEPGVWRTTGAGADLDIERVRDGWRFSHIEAPDEFIAIPHGVERAVSHGSYLVRIVRRGPAAASARANELRDDVRPLIERVVARATRRDAS
ncbi:MAG: acetyl-CoA carboxylase [Thermoleophilia bacterium]|nr:acetyl-CoA carboxylase [Thermoleophilia bacterium]